MRIKRSTALRTAAATFVLVLIAAGYVSQLGLGNLSDFGIGMISTICPLGFLESALAGRMLVPQAVLSLVVVVILTVILGKAFCAWICPIPLVQRLLPKRLRGPLSRGPVEKYGEDGPAGLAPGVDSREGVDAADEADGAMAPRQEEGLRPKRRPRPDSRLIVLGGALLSSLIFGFPVFCLVCPVGLTLATVLFLMRLFLFGEPTWTLLLLPAIVLLELTVLRRWCSSICPMGALFSLISGLNKTLRPRIDEGRCIESKNGAKCSQCSKACPEGINVRNLNASEAPLRECTKCRECADVCPARAISFPFIKPSAGAKRGVAEELPNKDKLG
jgi:ferredoxin-type protein NapH